LLTGGGGYEHVHVVPRTWTHLLFEAAGAPLDSAAAIPELWREYVSWATSQTAPERMTGRPGHHAHQEGRLPAPRADALTAPLPSPAQGVYAFVPVDRTRTVSVMAEIDGSRAFGIAADAMWAVVADPARLADWVPTMRLAQPSGKEEVHVEGESHGHPYSLDSLLRIDVSDRRLHWGAEGDEGYRGSLRVTERPSGSEVHLHVTVPDDRLGPSPESTAAEIRRGMEETFDRLAGLIAT
jgi:hypothetical protein